MVPNTTNINRTNINALENVNFQNNIQGIEQSEWEERINFVQNQIAGLQNINTNTDNNPHANLNSFGVGRSAYSVFNGILTSSISDPDTRARVASELAAGLANRAEFGLQNALRFKDVFLAVRIQSGILILDKKNPASSPFEGQAQYAVALSEIRSITTQEILNQRTTEATPVLQDSTTERSPLRETAESQVSRAVRTETVPSPQLVTANETIQNTRSAEFRSFEQGLANRALNSQIERYASLENVTAQAPEWLRENGNNNINTIRRLFIQNELNYGQDIRTHLNNLQIPLEEFIPLMSATITRGSTQIRTNSEVHANDLYAKTPLARIRLQSLKTRRAELTNQIQENRPRSINVELSAEERTANRENQRRLRAERDQIDQQISQLESGENNFQTFITELNTLTQKEQNNQLTNQERTSLNLMREIFANIHQILSKIPELRHQLPTVLENNYIKEAEIDNQLKSNFETQYRTIAGRNAELPFNLDSDNDQMTLLAILIEVYGDINSLRSAGIIEAGFELLEPGKINIRANPTIFILNLGTQSNIVLTLIRDYPELFTGNNATDNLVEAIRDLRQKSDYNSFRNSLTQQRTALANSTENTQEREQLLVGNFLNQIFPNRINGPLQRNGNIFNRRYRELTPDLLESQNSVQGQVTTDITNRSYTDAAMENYLLSSIRSYENGNVVYNLQNLEAVLERLLELGKVAALMRPSISQEDKNRLRTLDTSNFNLTDSNRTLSADEIQLIRLGFEMNRDLENSVDQRGIEISSEQILSETEQALRANPNLDPNRDFEALSTNVVTFLAGLDLTDPPLNISDLSGAIDVSFPLYENPDGTIRLGVSAGSIGTDQIPLADATPILGLNFRYNPEQGFGANANVNVGIGTYTGGGNINYTFENGFKVGASVNGGIYLGLPGVFGGINVGRTYNSGLERSMQRSAEGILRSLDSDTITRISRGLLTHQEILEIANNQPVINEVMSNLPEPFATSGIDTRLAENIKVYFITKMCEEIYNHGIENSDGNIGWNIGLSVGIINGVPILVPSVLFTIRTGTTMFYSTEIGASQAEAGAQARIRCQIEEAFANQATQSITRTVMISESGIINYDGQTGNREIIRSISPNSDLAQITQESGLSRLNQAENSVGLHFALPDPAINQPQTITSSNGRTSTITRDIDYVFSINDLNDQSGLGNLANREFNIYSDPALGIELVPLDHNLIGINFGPGQAVPPSNLAITRSEVTNSGGNALGSVAICFTNRAITPREIIENPFNQRVINLSASNGTRERVSPYFDSSVSNIDRARYRTQVESIQESHRGLSFSSQEIAAGTDLIRSIESSNSTTRFTPTNEMIQAGETLLANRQFMTELMQITTNQATETNFAGLSNGTLNTVEFKNLLERYLDQNPNDNITPEISDQMIMYLESILIPGTYRNLSDVSRRQRIASVNRVTQEVMGRFIDTFLTENRLNTHKRYNEQGELVEFTEQEKTTIRNRLIQSNILSLNEQSDEYIIERIQNLNEFTNALDSISIGSVLLTTAGVRNLAESHGFREMILHQNSNLQILAPPVFLSLDDNNTSDQTVAQFIRNIVEPPISNAPLESLTINEVSNIFNSETVLKILGMNFNYNNTNLPVVLALYGEQGTRIIQNLYEKSNNLQELTTYLSRLTQEDKNILNHFLDFTREIRSKTVNNSTVNLIPYGQTEAIGQMEVNLEAGTVFIANCGNLTMFYNFGFEASINTNVEHGIITAMVNSMSQYNATAQAETMNLGFSVAGDFQERRPQSQPTPEPEPEPEPDKPDEGITPDIPPTPPKLNVGVQPDV